MPVEQKSATAGPVLTAADLKRGFASPPPPQLQHSALYLSLPEAHLHRGAGVDVVVDGDATTELGRLPPRLARERIRIVRPSTAPLGAGGAAGSGSSATPPIAATTFMLQQQKAVEFFREQQAQQRHDAAQQREAKWAQMRQHQREMERKTTSESIKKRRMRIAKQVAAQQLKEQHDRERELLGYEERKHRTSVESAERRDRYAHAVALWRGVQDIVLRLNLAVVQSLEDRERTEWLEHFFTELEQKHRQAIIRVSSLSKTTILANEKAARITLQKHLAAIAAWKGEQDAEVNLFLAGERKARQKLYDEEAYGFLEIDSQKRALQQEQAKIARRRLDMLMAARREHERLQANARSQMEKDEADLRTAIRTENDTLRTLVRQDFVTEKRESEQRLARRLQREQEEWARECMRQLQPIVDDEEAGRQAQRTVEVNEWARLMSAKRQEWDDILIPIAFNTPPHAPPTSMTYQFHGPDVALFPEVTFRRKLDIRHYPAGPVLNAVLTVLGAGGVHLGDVVDVIAVEATSVREKKASPSGLRMIDSVLYDEEGTALCTVVYGSVRSVAELASSEEVGDALAKMGEQMQDSLPLITLAFNPIERDQVAAFLDRVVQALTFSADAASISMEPRTLKLNLSFSCGGGGGAGGGSGKQQRSARGSPPTGTPKPRNLGGGGGSPSPSSSAVSLNNRREAGSNPSTAFAQQDFNVSHVFAVVPSFPPVFLSAALRPSTRYFATAAVFDVRKRPDSGKMVVPLFPTASATASSSGSAVAADFRGTSMRLRYIEGFVADDAFHFASNEMFTLKKDEIKGPGGATIAKVFGKMLPAANASAKDITIQIGAEDELAPAMFERLLQRLHWTSTNASPANHRRIIELLITPSPQAQSATPTTVLRCEVVVVGTVSESATLSVDEASSVVRFCDSRIVTPKQLWPKLSSARSTVPLCIAPSLEAHGNLATRDLISAGSLRVSVVQNAYCWDHIGFNESLNNVGTLLVEGDSKVLWTSQPSVTDASALSLVGKIKRFTHLEGKLRPGLQVDLTDARINAVLALIKALCFRTDAVTQDSVCKVVLVELILPDSQARKAKGSPASVPARAFVTVEVVPSQLRSSIATSLTIPRVVEPVRLGCLSVFDRTALFLDGGSLTIEFADGCSGLEQLHFLSPPTSTPPPHVLSIENGPSKDLLLMRDHLTTVGAINEQGMGKPIKLRFVGKMRTEPRADNRVPAVASEVVAQILEQLAFQHSESDTELEKVLRVTLVDSFGCSSECAVVLDVTPVHMPSELADPPEACYYRAGSTALVGDGVLPLFSACTIVDEDTEFCGQGMMTIEPYVNVAAKDQLVLLTLPGEPGKSRKFVFHEHPVDPNKTAIHLDGKEFALCINESVDSGGNRLRFNIRTGTPLDLCTELMRRVGFRHTDPFPSRGSARQYLFKFNAGDEDVPDTRFVVNVHVNSPLLYTLPLYSHITVRPKVDMTYVFQKLMIGVAPTSSAADDALRFFVSKCDSDDSIELHETEDLYVEEGHLVASMALARSLSTRRVDPSPGFTGVCVGRVELPSDGSSIVLRFAAASAEYSVTAAIVPMIAGCVVFRSNPLAQKAPTRTVGVEWARKSPPETGILRCDLDVEAEDQMTQVVLERAMLTVFEGEATPLAAGVQVIDDDTEFFESDATLAIEVQNGISSQDFLSIVNGDGVECDGSDINVDGVRVAVLGPATTSRKLVLEPRHCPVATLQRVLRAVQYCGRNCAGRSKLIQILLRASAAVPPTTTNVQVSMLARPFALATRDVIEHPSNALGPSPLIRGVRVDPTINFSGVAMLFSVADGDDDKGGRLALPGDRVTMMALPDHLVSGQRGAISLKSGPQLCTAAQEGSSLRISFPASTKLATAIVVQDLLACVGYEFAEGDELGKSSDDLRKSQQAPKKPSVAAGKDGTGSPKAPKGSERGRINVQLTLTMPIGDGEVAALKILFPVLVV